MGIVLTSGSRYRKIWRRSSAGNPRRDAAGGSGGSEAGDWDGISYGTICVRSHLVKPYLFAYLGGFPGQYSSSLQVKSDG